MNWGSNIEVLRSVEYWSFGSTAWLSYACSLQEFTANNAGVFHWRFVYCDHVIGQAVR